MELSSMGGVQNQIIKVLKDSIEEYLKTTKFGAASGYRNSETGRLRANYLRKVLEVQKVQTNANYIWMVLWCTMKCNSTTLKDIIIEKIIYSGLLGDELYNGVKHKKNNMGLNEKEAKIKSIREICEAKTNENNMINKPYIKTLLENLDNPPSLSDLTFMQHLDRDS